MNKTIKKIAVLTSGGDAPGMNACLRAVVRKSIHMGLEVVGIHRGYQGLIEGGTTFENLNARSVSGIIHRGGTILRSARSKEFRKKEGRKRAHQNLKSQQIDALIAIGGDGTFRGANIFSTEFNFPVIGLPATIDNDIEGTDFTIGYDTAINTVVEVVDKIRDTASSHDRLFFVEVMGRDSGAIALNTGIAVGAEVIAVPETYTDLSKIVANLKKGKERGKTSSIVIVAEGDEVGGAKALYEAVEKQLAREYEIRTTILGHLQRGGAPSCMDRVLASRLGVAAVDTLLAGKTRVMVGIINQELVCTPLMEVTQTTAEQTKKHRQRAAYFADLAAILSI